eukprot:tig00000880_g5178.t1
MFVTPVVPISARTVRLALSTSCIGSLHGTRSTRRVYARRSFHGLPVFRGVVSFRHPERLCTGTLRAMASSAAEQPGGLGSKTPQQVFKELATLSSASEAWLLPGDGAGQRILVRSSQRDLKQKKQRSFITQHATEGGAVRQTAIPIEVPSEVAVSVSPSGRYTAYFRPVPDAKADEAGRPKGYVEVWDQSGIVANIATEGKHGAVYADEWFKGFSWSADESRLAYVAEQLPPPPAAASVFDEDQGGNREVAVRDAFNFGPKEDWGETYVRRRCPRPFIADIRAEQIVGIEPRGLPARLTAGQVTFAPGDEALVVTCWETEPRRLGIVYCYNRPSRLYLVPLNARTTRPLTGKKDEKKEEAAQKEAAGEGGEEEAVPLECGDPMARSPRFSPDGRSLAFLSSEALGPHFAAARLRILPWAEGRPAGPPRVVVDIVDEAAGGVDAVGLLERPRRRRRRHGGRRAPHAGPLRPRAPNAAPAPLASDDVAWSLLDAAGTTLLAAAGGGRGARAGPIAWRPVLQPAAPFPDIAASVFTLRPEASRRTAAGHARDGKARGAPGGAGAAGRGGGAVTGAAGAGEHADDYEALLLRPRAAGAERAGERPPLVGFVHGGPHSAFAGEYLLSCAAYCRLGLAVLLVNYRGSLGAGQAPLLSLLGRVGEQDVRDSHEAVEAARASGLVDPSRVFITGGSHGGFLSLHLIGQYPDAYRAAVARNPVTNIASMTGVTDIPDWCFVEGGLAEAGVLPASRERPLTPPAVAALYAASPAAHVHKARPAPPRPARSGRGGAEGAGGVRAGEGGDAAAGGGEGPAGAPSQGLDYYHALRALGVEARLLTYPEDVHALARVEAESDGFVNGAYWILEHL